MAKVEQVKDTCVERRDRGRQRCELGLRGERN